MANKKIGEYGLTKREKYKKYPPKVAIPEPCPEYEECEECADGTCEPCDACSPEGTFCVGDGFATCDECQQAWCECEAELAACGCNNPLADPEINVTVLESGVEVISTDLINVGSNAFTKILPAFYHTDVEFDISIIAPLTGTNHIYMEIKYGSLSNPSYFTDYFPHTPGTPAHYSFPNVDNQVVYLRLNFNWLTTSFYLLPTLVGVEPFEDCTECVAAYGDLICGTPAIPLPEPETYFGHPILIIDDNETIAKFVWVFSEPIIFKISVADFTDSVDFKIVIDRTIISGFCYLKAGSVATDLSYDIAHPITSSSTTIANIPTTVAQDIYLTFYTTPSAYRATVTPTRNNHSPYANCNEVIDDLNACNADLAVAEYYQENYNTILDELLLCSFEDNFLTFLSGGSVLAYASDQSACWTVEEYISLIGDEIFLNPNLCSPDVSCDVFGNFCYCINVDNLNALCLPYNMGVDGCPDTPNTTALFYIATRSAWDFTGHETFLKTEITNFAGPGDLFEYVCESYNTDFGYYNHLRVYKINNAIFSMVSTLTAEVTFTNTIDFVDAVPPRSIPRSTKIYINLP